MGYWGVRRSSALSYGGRRLYKSLCEGLCRSLNLKLPVLLYVGRCAHVAKRPCVQLFLLGSCIICQRGPTKSHFPDTKPWTKAFTVPWFSQCPIIAEYILPFLKMPTGDKESSESCISSRTQISLSLPCIRERRRNPNNRDFPFSSFAHQFYGCQSGSVGASYQMHLIKETRRVTQSSLATVERILVDVSDLQIANNIIVQLG